MACAETGSNCQSEHQCILYIFIKTANEDFTYLFNNVLDKFIQKLTELDERDCSVMHRGVARILGPHERSAVWDPMGHAFCPPLYINAKCIKIFHDLLMINLSQKCQSPS